MRSTSIVSIFFFFCRVAGLDCVRTWVRTESALKIACPLIHSAAWQICRCLICLKIAVRASWIVLKLRRGLLDMMKLTGGTVEAK